VPHIALPDRLFGITGAFAFRAATAKPMRERARRVHHAAPAATKITIVPTLRGQI
jgi:hypothetical protein